MSEYDQFMKFIIERQKMYFSRKAGKPWPWSKDFVLNRAKINNIFRANDKLSVLERSLIKDLPFNDQLKTILLIRHGLNNHIYNVVKNPKFTKSELSDLKSRHSLEKTWITGNIIFYSAPGTNVLNTIYDHAKLVHKITDKLSNRLLSLETPELVIKFIGDSYPHLGKFKIYEVFTSLTYCEQFKFTENDFLHLGPGSKHTVKEVLGVQDVNLGSLIKIATKINDLLHRKNLLEGLEFTVRSLEDSLCEYRKYKTACYIEQNPQCGLNYKTYRPDFWPSVLAHEKSIRGGLNLERSKFYKFNGKDSQLKAAAKILLPRQPRLLIQNLKHGQFYSYKDMEDISRLQGIEQNIRAYFMTLRQLGFLEVVK